MKKERITDFKAIGKRIRYYRIRRGITQEKLAEKIGRNNCYISAVENGHTELPLDVLVRICNELEVTANDILAENLKFSSEVVDNEIIRETEDFSAVDKWFVVAIIRDIKAHLPEYQKNLFDEVDKKEDNRW